MPQTNISLERVIGGLECCATDRKRREDCEAISCPYLDLEGHGCIHQLIRDAFALAKKQQPVKPLIADAYNMYFCGNCKHAIPRATNYCPKCGKKVEWND